MTDQAPETPRRPDVPRSLKWWVAFHDLEDVWKTLEGDFETRVGDLVEATEEDIFRHFDERPRLVQAAIKGFSAQCERAAYTDTGDAWLLFQAIASYLTDGGGEGTLRSFAAIPPLPEEHAP